MLSDLPRQKMMAEKLFIEVQHGRIEDEWSENFISDVYHRLLRGMPLTEKQIIKLESLWERY